MALIRRRLRTRPLRFRRSVVRDLRNRLRFAIVGLLVLIGLHVAAMVAFEGLSVGDAIWLTFTTITTTGYGDFSAKTHAGRASTIVLIYLSGIFMLTQAGAAFFELRALRRDRQRRGEWRCNMRDHIVFVNAPETEPGDYLRRLLGRRMPALRVRARGPDLGRDRRGGRRRGFRHGHRLHGRVERAAHQSGARDDRAGTRALRAGRREAGPDTRGDLVSLGAGQTVEVVRGPS